MFILFALLFVVFICQAVNDIFVGDILRTNCIASAAAYAHGITKAFFEIIDFMHYLKAHTRAFIISEIMAAGNVGVTVHLAGSPDSAALSCLFVILIEDILHGEAGAGRTGKIATSAGDASTAVVLPDGVVYNILWQIGGKGNLLFVLGHEIRSYIYTAELAKALLKHGIYHINMNLVA